MGSTLKWTQSTLLLTCSHYGARQEPDHDTIKNHNFSIVALWLSWCGYPRFNVYHDNILQKHIYIKGWKVNQRLLKLDVNIPCAQCWRARVWEAIGVCPQRVRWLLTCWTGVSGSGCWAWQTEARRLPVGDREGEKKDASNCLTSGLIYWKQGTCTHYKNYHVSQDKMLQPGENQELSITTNYWAGRFNFEFLCWFEGVDGNGLRSLWV